MLRGEIRLVNLEPVKSSEAGALGKVRTARPAVVVSNDALNSTTESLNRGIVTVVPITSNIARVYPFQVRLPRKITGLSIDSKAQAEQIRSVAISRIGKRVGRLTKDLQDELDLALRLHLDL